MLRLTICISIAFIFLLLFAPLSNAAIQNKSNVRHLNHTQPVHNHSFHNGKRLFLVPPPPPYVPSSLPDYRYQGHLPYGYFRSGAAVKVFKPNKYLTYYF
jgi:hypothetical protein